MPRIFINFRSDDEVFAAMLIDAKMTERFTANEVFRDNRSIPLGQEFTSKLWDSLARTDILLAVIGPRWLTLTKDGIRRLDHPDDYVRRELEFALNHGIRVVPVLIGDTPLPPVTELPESIAGLATRQYLRVWPRNAHRDLDVLADELSALLDGGRPTVPPAVAAEAIEASNYSIVVLKIDGFAARPDALQTELRRQLYAILPEAAMDAGLDWDSVRRSDRIDGVFLLIPGPPAPSRVLVGLVEAIHQRLAIHPDLRLRIGMHTGRASRDATGWAGRGLTLAAGLADAPVLGPVLAAATRARLVLIVSEEMHRGVVLTAHRDLDPAAYGEVFVDDGGTDLPAWVYVPGGYPSPPGLPPLARPATPATVPGPPATPVFMAPGVFHVTTGGTHNVVSGSGQLSNNTVQGDQYNSGGGAQTVHHTGADDRDSAPSAGTGSS
jgi:hypothetical protein